MFGLFASSAYSPARLSEVVSPWHCVGVENLDIREVGVVSLGGSFLGPYKS